MPFHREARADGDFDAGVAVSLLLDLGADVNAVNDDGDTVMHGAAHDIYARPEFVDHYSTPPRE